jgi:hypothetical protein
MAQDDPLRDAMNMLSHEQLEALRAALARSGGRGRRSRGLSESDLKALKEEAGSYRHAQRQAAEAIGVLWNARLDIAITTGDVSEIQNVLLFPREAFYDNCNCGGGGGGGTGYW